MKEFLSLSSRKIQACSLQQYLKAGVSHWAENRRAGRKGQVVYSYLSPCPRAPPSLLQETGVQSTLQKRNQTGLELWNTRHNWKWG